MLIAFWACSCESIFTVIFRRYLFRKYSVLEKVEIFLHVNKNVAICRESWSRSCSLSGCDALSSGEELPVFRKTLVTSCTIILELQNTASQT